MVCLDMDHPDIEDFVNWKVREEIKVQAMVEGLKVIADKKSGPGDSLTIGETAKKLGLKLDYDFNGEAYLTVSGQNSNNSVRISDDFFKTLDGNGEWKTYYRTGSKDGQPQGRAHVQGERIVGPDGYAARRRRSRRAVRHHDQRVAHVPGGRPHQREQPVQRVHVPGQHGVQPRVDQRP